MPRLTIRLVPALGLWILAASATGGEPADELLRITPTHSAATLVVEGLRDQAREILGSPLFDRLGQSAAVQEWAGSPSIRQLRESSRQVEATFGMPITSIRDRILGDAAVLAFFPGPLAAPQESRGLLLIHRQDRDLVEKLFEAINRAQQGSGEVIRLERRTRGTIDYTVRVYRPGTRSDECYAHLDHEYFAWSNSEALLQNVIDLRLGGGRGLADDESFAKVRRGLTGRAPVSLVLAPEMIRRFLAEARPAANGLERVAGLLVRQYAPAIGAIGVGMEWTGGPAIHVHESLLLDKLEPSVRRWLAAPPAPPDLAASMPASATAIFGINLDLPALRRMIVERMDPADLGRLENIRELARALLAGVDPITELMPRLEPGILGFLDTRSRPDRRPLFPLVGVLRWSRLAGQPVLEPAIESGLRGLLALQALGLGGRPNVGDLGVRPLVLEDIKMTVLTDGRRNLAAYRVEEGRLIFGNAAEAAKRFGPAQLPSIIQDLRARHCGNASTFAVVDLDRLVMEVGRARTPIAQGLAAGSTRSFADIDRDLYQLLGLAGLFRASVFASEVSAGGSEIHRKLRLIPR